MKHTTALGILLLFTTGSSATAQGKDGLPPPPVEGVLEDLHAADNPQEEILELFRSVEKRLNAIDELLSDASAGQSGQLANASESGVSRLIERSRESSRLAVEEIDRLLDLLNTPPP